MKRRRSQTLRPAGIAIAAIAFLASFVEMPWSDAQETAGTRVEAGGPALVFERDVQPILAAHCTECHGGETRRAGLDLRSFAGLARGGESGPAVVAGASGESLLIDMLVLGEMPPEGNEPLSDQEIATITAWIDSGAAALRTDDPYGPQQRIAEDPDYWAFQPPVRPQVPQVQASHLVRNPIDAFLLARLEAEGLSFSEEADRLTLLRRATFDLTGLPPTPEEIDAFLADREPYAYERLIDRLLASPHYGERWGRHWLDAAGYADSDGYLDADRVRPEMWRYRDYVIRSLNMDKPFDQFLIEQLAGDELADYAAAERMTPEMADRLIATGFLRCGPDPTYDTYRDRRECFGVIDDTITILSSSVLGLTMHCARCHDHKFDPITQRDYYRLQAIFIAAYNPDDWTVSPERNIPMATRREQEEIAAHNGAIDAEVAALNAQLEALAAPYRPQLLEERIAELPEEERCAVRAALATAEEKRSDEQRALLARHEATLAITHEALAERFPEYAQPAGALRAQIDAADARRRTIVPIRGLYDMSPEPPVSYLLRRGNWDDPGPEVTPGVPEALDDPDDPWRVEEGALRHSTGRRLALARWLVREDHPLTARVLMNRVWQHHFGAGIVATPENFGASGARPTHPELLDWLATEFVRRGWSLKAMHRLMMTSTAYRQTSRVREMHPSEEATGGTPVPLPLPTLVPLPAFCTRTSAVESPLIPRSPGEGERESGTDVDPDNHLLWRMNPRRLEGEEVRDAILAASGALDLEMYGPAVPVEAMPDGQIIVPDNPGGWRRSVYVLVRRSQPVSLLNVFDTPVMATNCLRRDSSVVVSQALELWNSDFVIAHAARFAERVRTQAGEDREARLRLAVRLAYGRDPTRGEQETLAAFLDEQTARHLSVSGGTAGLPSSGAEIIDEARTAAGERAWADLCQVLLNSNEFLYLD